MIGKEAESMALELSRQKVRKQALAQFKHIRTCVLARELCLLIRTRRATLNKEDVQTCCGVISKLCKEAGCDEASDLCAKAVEAVTESEEPYLALCEKSCNKCSESRIPRQPTPSRPTPDRTVYVA